MVPLDGPRPYGFGTSLSTALVSAVAAQVQAKRLQGQLSALPTETLAAVLHASGRPTAVIKDDSPRRFCDREQQTRLPSGGAVSGPHNVAGGDL